MSKAGNIKRVGSTAQRLRELPYEKRVCKVESYPPCSEWDFDGDGPSVEEYVDFLADVGLEVHTIQGSLNRGSPRFASQMLPPHPHLDSDPLPRFLELCHEKGIIVLSYYPLIFNKQLRAVHPEWLVKMFDEPSLDLPYGNRGWWCLNSPFRDWIVDYLNEFLDNLDLDGFYFDDTNIGSHSDHPPNPPREYPGCHCQYCEKLFREDTGLAIPRNVDFDSLNFRRYLGWRYEKLRESIRYIFRGIKDKHPDAVLEFYFYTRPSTDWVRGHPLNPFNLGLDGLGYSFTEMERSLRDTGYIGKINRGKGTEYSLLRSDQQKLLDVAGGTGPYPEPYAFMTHGLSAIANGGRAFVNFRYPHLQWDAVKQAFAELKKRADYIEGDTVKHVALHYSMLNRDFRPNQMPKNLGKVGGAYAPEDTYGVYEMLNRSHILVDFLFDEQLTIDELCKYPLLFLSNSTCLTDEQCEQIRKYVEDGGTLIATYETSLMDELGRARDNFALADVLGVNYSVGTFVHEGRHPWQIAPKKGITCVPHDADLKAEFGYLIVFAATDCEIVLRPESDTTVLATKSTYQISPPGDMRAADRGFACFRPGENYDSTEPAVTVNRFGKGRAFYIAADVGGGYVHNPYPLLKRLVVNLVRRTQVPIEFDAPQAIEVTAAFRDSGELMIHLLNNPMPFIPPSISGEHISTYCYHEEIVPVRDVGIKVNDMKIESATMPLQSCTLEAGQDATYVLVPEVKLHEVVLLELAD